MMKELHTLDHSVAITDDEEEIVEVWTTPQANPKTFRKRVKSLMISGFVAIGGRTHCLHRTDETGTLL